MVRTGVGASVVAASPGRVVVVLLIVAPRALITTSVVLTVVRRAHGIAPHTLGVSAISLVVNPVVLLEVVVGATGASFEVYTAVQATRRLAVAASALGLLAPGVGGVGVCEEVACVALVAVARLVDCQTLVG